MKTFVQFAVALALLLVASVSFAADGGGTAPAWVYSLLGFVAAIVGLISQVDAQISEDFKRRWPWWLSVPWDLIAGNYKHSKNRDSE